MKKEFIIRLLVAMGIGLFVLHFGIKPMLEESLIEKSKTQAKWAKDQLVPLDGVYDVVVIGEEPEGIAASISAARAGARVLLLSGGKDLGGIVSRALCIGLEPNLNQKGEVLNMGIFYEIYNRLYYGFTIKKYKDTVQQMIQNEKDIEVIYEAVPSGVIIENRTVKGIHALVGGKTQTFHGKRFIDATRDGDVLAQCGVPFFTGSGDLNMKQTFMPVRFNFLMSGVNISEYKSILSDPEKSKQFLAIIDQYKPKNPGMTVQGFTMVDQGDGQSVLQGIELANIDLNNPQLAKRAFMEAIEESKTLAEFLASRLAMFKNARWHQGAEEFYIRENRHFQGEYMLRVSEILENTDFNNKIAIGSHSVEAGKFADNGSRYVVGKPALYGVPLGCLIPVNVDNIMMVGSKASYSSLAASSAGNMGISITEGEAAGIVQVFTIINNIKPRDILKPEHERELEKLKEILGRYIYLPEIKEKNQIMERWSYPELKGLINLGLVAGGAGNDFKLEKEAKEEDMAMLLLNGVYRVSSDKYSLKLDNALRPYFNTKELSKERAAQMIAALHGIDVQKSKVSNAYDLICEKGYIDPILQLELKEKKVLSLEDVFYLSAYNIKRYTGKELY